MFEFPKSKRLLTKNDFTPAMETGEKVVCPELVVLQKQRPSGTASDQPARLGLVVSKKVGNAVERNRVKRILREAFRHTTQPNGVNCDVDVTGFDTVVIARAKASTVSNEVLTQAFERSLRKLAAKRIKKPQQGEA